MPLGPPASAGKESADSSGEGCPGLSAPAAAVAPAVDGKARSLRNVGLIRLRLAKLLTEQRRAAQDSWATLEKQHNASLAREALTNQSNEAGPSAVKARILRRFDLPVRLRLVLHDHAAAPGREGEHACLLEVLDSIRLPDLQQLVSDRFAARQQKSGGKSRRLRPMWVKSSGETVPIDSQRTLHAWFDDKWCSHPVVLHVLDEETATSQALDLADQASAVFEQHDEDGSGSIDAAELTRMLQGLLRQSVPGCSERLVQHWVEAEFTQADTDGNGTLDFDEFCLLFNRLSEWSRRQVSIATHQHVSVAKPDPNLNPSPSPNQVIATNQHVQLYKHISEHYLEVGARTRH